MVDVPEIVREKALLPGQARGSTSLRSPILSHDVALPLEGSST